MRQGDEHLRWELSGLPGPGRRWPDKTMSDVCPLIIAPMRYFTAEMWAGWQADDEGVDWFSYYRKACQDYRKQLNGLVKRLSPKAAQFFDTDRHILHDGVLSERRVENFDFRRPPDIRLVVESSGTGSQERRWYRYVLTYRKVTKLAYEQPAGARAGFSRGVVRWRYDELTDAEEGKLRHGILFDSFATLEIVFEGFTWQRRQLKP